MTYIFYIWCWSFRDVSMKNYYPCWWVQAQGNSKQDALKTVQRVVNKILVKGQAIFVEISKAIFLILDAIIFKHIPLKPCSHFNKKIILMVMNERNYRLFSQSCFCKGFNGHTWTTVKFHVIYLYIKHIYIHICRTATWASLELPIKKICILSHLHTAGLLYCKY